MKQGSISDTNKNKKVGVLVVNLGTPDAPTRGAVYRYLKQFLLDGRVIDIPAIPRHLLVRGIIAPFRSGSSAKLYQQLWTPEGSPIKIYGHKVVQGLQESLPDNYFVELAMRYQNPSLQSALEKLLDKHVDEIIVFPLFPQYSSACTGSIHEEVMRLLSKQQLVPELKLINSYHDRPEVIDIYAENARKYNLGDYDHFVFSFHGVPQRQMKKADRTKSHCIVTKDCCNIACEANKYCYSAQCHQTAHAIAANLGLSKDQYSISYQSRLGRDPWLQPYTDETLEHLLEQGKKNILVFSPAFVADCLETTIEIGFEYKEDFDHNGGERLDLVESLNDNPKWIAAIKTMILEHSHEPNLLQVTSATP